MSFTAAVLLVLVIGVPLVVWALGLIVTSIAKAIDLLTGENK